MIYLLCGPKAEECWKVINDAATPSRPLGHETVSFLLVPKASDSARAEHASRGGRVLYCDQLPNGQKRFQEDLPCPVPGTTIKAWWALTWEKAWADRPRPDRIPTRKARRSA